MELAYVFITVILSALFIGVCVSIFYTGYLLWKYFNESLEDNQEEPLIAETNSSTEVATPVFGEGAWLHMAGLAMLFLLSRCGWQNSSKVLMQLNWTNESSERQDFRKPLFISFLPMVAMALYFPFCGMPANAISKDLFETLVYLATLQLGNLLLFMYGVKLLPISTAVVVRAGASMLFVGVFSYFRNQMNLNVALSMAVVLLGTLLGSLSPALLTGRDSDQDLWDYLVGLTALVCSAFCQAGRMALQEITFGGNKRMSAVQLSSAYSLLSCSFFLVVAWSAQFLPGYDHGVQEDTWETLHTIVSSGELQPYLSPLLILLWILCTANIILLAALVRLYGATTARVLMSLEIFATWLFAAAIYYATRAWAIVALDGVGEAFDLSESYLKLVGGLLIVAGTELYLRSKREMLTKS